MSVVSHKVASLRKFPRRLNCVLFLVKNDQEDEKSVTVGENACFPCPAS